MDADNVAISDPTHLFQSPEFRETGAVMWHDYWDASWAPDAPAILGVKPDQLPQYTHDSGQMLFDKSRCEFTRAQLTLQVHVCYIFRSQDQCSPTSQEATLVFIVCALLQACHSRPVTLTYY